MPLPFQAFDLKVHFFSSRFRFVTKYFLISIETLLKSFLLKKGEITLFAISSHFQLGVAFDRNKAMFSKTTSKY